MKLDGYKGLPSLKQSPSGSTITPITTTTTDNTTNNNNNNNNNPNNKNRTNTILNPANVYGQLITKSNPRTAASDYGNISFSSSSPSIVQTRNTNNNNNNNHTNNTSPLRATTNNSGSSNRRKTDANNMSERDLLVQWKMTHLSSTSSAQSMQKQGNLK